LTISAVSLSGEQIPLKMVVIHVLPDDHTYKFGDMECDLDDNGDGIEPFIHKDGDVTVECYVSKHLYIERATGEEITKVVHTCTCWSDDSDSFTIQNNKVVFLDSTEHGINHVYINYDTEGVTSKIEYSRREFGCFKIGQHAPDLDDLIAKTYELVN
jgi:hypothetical protein